MSSNTDITQYYEDLASNYDSRFNNQRLDYMRYAENKAILDNLKTGLILDIGCGTGEQTLLLANNGYTVIGIDISMEMIKKANDRIHQAKLDDKISLLVASAQALPFRDESVDGLISIFGVYSHVPMIDQAFEEISRVVRTGSKSIITVVNRWNITWWTRTFFRGKVNWLLHALKNKEYTVNGLWTYYFSKGELTNLLQSAGFKVRIGSLLILLYPHNNKKLRFYEKMFIRFEEKARWIYPFNGFGYYHLAIFKKND
ncbi:MAG: methyltransferase domain-containing protein [Methanosarcinales archaeon]|nr:methyltransferase domain-containing protein [Methanosarcinales archaeon]